MIVKQVVMHQYIPISLDKLIVKNRNLLNNPLPIWNLNLLFIEVNYRAMSPSEVHPIHKLLRTEQLLVQGSVLGKSKSSTDSGDNSDLKIN